MYTRNSCSNSPWCDEDCCKCDAWEVFEGVREDNKYELYCTKCNATIGYTNHEFVEGEAMMSKLVTLDDGTNPKPWDRIKCLCPNSNNLRIRSRTNELYKPR